MTMTEAKLCAVLLLAFVLALVAMAAAPSDTVITTLGGCPPALASGR